MQITNVELFATFEQNQTVAGQAAINAWLAALQQQIAAPVAVRPNYTTSIVFVVFSIAFFLLGVLIKHPGPFIVALGGVGFAVGALVLAQGQSRTSTKQINARLRDYILPVMSVLSADLNTSVPVTLTVDLRGSSMKTKLKERFEDQHQGYPRRSTAVYIDPWFTGSCQLVDGTRLRWQLTDYVQQRTTTKRSSSGKIKRKSKTKTRHIIMLALDLRDQYAPTATMPDQTLRFQTEYRPERQRIIVRQRFEWHNNKYHSPQQFLDTMAHLYRQIQPVPHSR